MTSVRIIIRFYLVFCIGSLSACASEPLTVFSASGISPALEPICAAYEKQTHVKIYLNTDATSRLAKQIEAGAPCDVFISANPEWVDYLEDKDLTVPATRRIVATTRLVLIGATPSHATIELHPNVAFPAMLNGTLAIGEPAHVPVGMYAVQALKYMGWWEEVRNRVIPAANVADVLRFVESGQCDTGVVYASMAFLSLNISVLGTFPAISHDPILFVATSPTDKTEGLEFLDFVQTPGAQAIMSAYGFQTASLPNETTLAQIQLEVSHTQILPAVLLSLRVALVCMLIVLVPGILLGWVLARKNFYGKSTLEAIVLLPLVIPPVVTGYLALLVLGKNGLLGHYLFDACGISIPFTWFAVVVTSAIMGMPLLIRSVKTAVQMIDPRLEQAASTLGKSPIQVFFTVTIPLALPGILSGLSLAFARSLGEFGATATFAGNIPGKTRTLSLAIHSLTQIPNGNSAALKLAAIAVGISILALYCSEKLIQRSTLRLNSSCLN